MSRCFASFVSAALCLGLAVNAFAAEKYALLVGVTKYEHSGMSPLQYPEVDATDLGQVLEQGGYTVELLLGKEATQAAIQKKLEAMKDKAEADGVVLVGLFGHGIETERVEDLQLVKDGCFCPFDTKLREVKDPKGKTLYTKDRQPLTEPDPSSLVWLSEVLTSFKLAKAGSRVLLADCCRVVPNQARGRSFGTGFKASDLPENTAVLFGCSPSEQAFEHKNWGHGAFTKCLLDELAVMTKEGDVTTGTLGDRLKKQVPDLVASVSPKDTQTPKAFSTDTVDLQLASIGPDGKAMVGKTKPALGAPSTPGEPSNTPTEGAEGETESFFEDFRDTANAQIPDGWVRPNEKGTVLAVRQDAGRPHLRVADSGYLWNGEEDRTVATIRLPPITITGDFYIELPTLSNVAWPKKVRSIVITLKNGDDEKLVCRTFEDTNGFVTTLPNSEESKPFTLSGTKPYRLRLERQGGVYRFNSNGKTVLTHEADDHRTFDICELELSPFMMVGSVKIGPLNEKTADKAEPEKPTSKKPVLPRNRR